MKTWITIFASIPLLWIAYFYLSENKISVIQPSLALNGSGGVSSSLTERDKLNVHHELVQKEKETIDQIKARRLENYKKSAELVDSISPHIYERYKIGFTKKKEPKIRGFLAAWNLDENKLKRVIDITLDREMKLIAEDLRFSKERPSEVGDNKDSKVEATSYKKTGAVRESIRLESQVELLVLLGGSDRLKQFEDFEKSLKSAASID